MKIMLDVGATRLQELTERYQFDFWQLRTPLTNRALQGVRYGLDNGCFKEFKQSTWLRLVEQAREIEPEFVCLPDVVGDARRTGEMAEIFSPVLDGLPKCLVLQDGIGQLPIDWDDISAIFIGGSDAFKLANESMAAAKAAKLLGKWVHVGRVNTVSRLKHWECVADSIDGSGISRYDHMLDKVMRYLQGDEDQGDLFDGQAQD